MNNNRFGLKDNDIEQIVEILSRYPEVEKGCIFGSRSKGNYKTGSDVDIALSGRELTFATTIYISSVLNEETLMPYKFDVLGYNTINSIELLEHINRVGVEIYKKLPVSSQAKD